MTWSNLWKNKQKPILLSSTSIAIDVVNRDAKNAQVLRDRSQSELRNSSETVAQMLHGCCVDAAVA